MTNSEYSPPPRREETQPTCSAADALDAVPQLLRNDIFDAELFEELRDLLGSAYAAVALEELSASLQAMFPDLSAQCTDREQVFRHAHLIVADAGMMGFTALRDAALALQEGCATGSPIDEQYERVREAAQATCDTIAVLQQKPL